MESYAWLWNEFHLEPSESHASEYLARFGSTTQYFLGSSAVTGIYTEKPYEYCVIILNEHLQPTEITIKIFPTAKEGKCCADSVVKIPALWGDLCYMITKSCSVLVGHE